jgi:hypothetical protein
MIETVDKSKKGEIVSAEECWRSVGEGEDNEELKI